MATASGKQTQVFTPTQISGCQLWLDAADSTSLTLSGSSVSQWNDKSGSGNNATATGTITNTGSINSKVALNWSGSVSTYFSGALTNTGTTLTAFSVFNMNSSSYATARILSLAKPGFFDFNNTAYVAAIERQTGSIFNAYRNNANLSQVSANFGVPVLVCSQFDGTNHTFYLNGTGGTPVASSGNFGFTNYLVGSSFGEENLVPLNGQIAEVVYFGTSLTNTQRQQIEGYLAWKWGLQGSLPSTHPYKNTPLYQLPPLPLLPAPTRITKQNQFTPVNVDGCSIWLDASDRSSITLSGSSVSQWSDKSGNGMTVSAASARPTYTSNAQNGLGVVRYDGTQNLTSGSVLASKFAGNTNNLTMFCVFSLSNTVGSGTYAAPFCWANGGGYPRIALTAGDALGGFMMDVGNSSGRTIFTPPPPTTDNTFYFTSYWKNGANTQLNLNGSNKASSNAQDTTGFASSSYEFNVGNGFSNSVFWMRGNIGEIVFYNRTLNTDAFQAVEGYLAWKWGLQASLPTTHPYYNRNTILYSLPPMPTTNIAKYAIQGKAFFIDTPLWFSLGIPTSNFSASLPITLAGNASYTNNILQLTPNSALQTGSAFFQRQVRILRFSTQFNLRFDSTQADGATFCIQNSSSNAMGTSGGDLGYAGITNSVAIRFDSYNGAGGNFSTDILTGGTSPTQQAGSGVLNTTFGLTAGGTWNFLVNASYDGTTLSYTIRNFNNLNQSFSSNRTINLGTTIGSSNAWIGFTSATGGLTESCSVISWTWSNAK